MLTGTLVTAAGFIPVGFAASAVAEYAGGIFWVVAISLIVSWFVAVIFTPYLGVMLLPRKMAAAHDPYGSPTYRVLRAVIDACLRHRLKVIGATAVIFVLAIIGFGNVQQQFFPTAPRQHRGRDRDHRTGRDREQRRRRRYLDGCFRRRRSKPDRG